MLAIAHKPNYCETCCQLVSQGRDSTPRPFRLPGQAVREECQQVEVLTSSPARDGEGSTFSHPVVSSLLFGTLRGSRGEGAVACYGLAHYEGVHVVRALIGVDALDIGHVLHHAVV